MIIDCWGRGENNIFIQRQLLCQSWGGHMCVWGLTNMCSSSLIYMCGLKSIIWEGRRYCWSMMSIWMHGAFVECSGWRRNDFCWTRAGSSGRLEQRSIAVITQWDELDRHQLRFLNSCIRPLAKSRIYPDLLGEIFFALRGVLKGRLGGTSSMAWNVTTGKDGNPRHAKLAATF